MARSFTSYKRFSQHLAPLRVTILAADTDPGAGKSCDYIVDVSVLGDNCGGQSEESGEADQHIEKWVRWGNELEGGCRKY